MHAAFSWNEHGPCLLFSGVEIALRNLVRMEGVASTPSGNTSEVILKCSYSSGRTRTHRVRMPRPVHELYQTISTIEPGGPVTRIYPEILPALSRSEFESRLAAMQKGERG